MWSVLVLTVSGKDQAGLVGQLAEVIARHGGNWEHCRMVHLAGRFVGLLQVGVPSESQQDLEMSLRTIKDLDVMIASGSAEIAAPDRHFDLEVVGSDHPGIVSALFKVLADAGVNVEELKTTTETGAQFGEILFRAQARLGAGWEVDRENLRQQLEQIAQDLMVEVNFAE